MKRHILAGTVLALMAGTAQAQAPARDPGPNAPIRYDVRFDNAAHHEARISVTYRDLKPGPVTFRMARSSPGRYALQDRKSTRLNSRHKCASRMPSPV